MSTHLTFTHKRHGSFTVTTDGIDWAMGKYLPASNVQLQEHITEVTGFDYSDIHSTVELLAIMADLYAPDVSHSWAAEDARATATSDTEAPSERP